MKRSFLLWIIMTFLCRPLFAQVDVLTQRYDNKRTGWNSQETMLTPSNVKAGFFGKLFSYDVDDQVYAQPLIVTGVNIPGKGTRDVAYICTVNNTVYAYDADSAIVGGTYWQDNLTLPGNRTPLNTDMVVGLCPAITGGYQDLSGKIGIIGTPVIDKSAGFLYLVSRDVTTDASKTFTQYLYKIDLTNGNVITKTLITASVPGNGAGSSGGVLPFNAQSQNQRPGLLLLNGVIYIGYGSHCDMPPYHGWLLGYDATSLTQKYVYCSTPDADGGGIWQSGNGVAADDAGNIYFSTGNGDGGNEVDVSQNGGNKASALIKITPPATGSTMTVADWFIPNDFPDLNNGDDDFGPCETLIIPGLNRVLTGAKDNRLYLADVNNLGHYNASVNQLADSLNLGVNARNHISFGYYHGTANEFLYTWPENANLSAWTINRGTGKFNHPAFASAGLQGPVGNSGSSMTTSSNGSTDNTAVLWVTHPTYPCDANHQTCPGMFRAVNATNINQELWNSTQVTGDTVGNWAKFNAPVVANGKVYIGSFSKKVWVYGLANNGDDTCNTPDVAAHQPAFASSTEFPPGGGTDPALAFDSNFTTTRWSSQYTDNQWIYVDLGKSYDLCKVIIYWQDAFASAYNIQVSNNASTWTTIKSVTGNGVKTNALPLQGSGRYVRMQGVTRATGYGYSIFEMQVFGTPTVTCFPPSGLTSSNIQQNSATMTWNAVSGATGYVLQYKPASSSTWTVVNTATTSVSVTGLACGTDYIFEVQTNCSASETSSFASAGFSTIACTSGCGTLPTRWTGGDVGSASIAGQSCFSGSTFTLKGSGTGIGGTADGFQFAYQTLSGDDQFIAQVLTLDNDPGDMTGIMIRNDLTASAANAFVGVTSGGSNAVFTTRATAGGPTTTNTVSIPGVPYWVKLQKAGSVYSAYTSPNGNTWTQLGTSTDLGFGAAGSTNAGLVITSANNALSAQSTIDNMTQGSALPIVLLRFTGHVSGEQTVLQWATAMEENAGFFEVQRSADGVHFTTTTTVQAIGNSATEQDYSTVDAQPLKGINYYRLREVDLDGNAAYSPIIIVRFSTAQAPLILPNPATSYFQLVAGTDPIKEVNLYDLAGRRMFSMLNGSATGTVTIPITHLSQGIYLVEIRTANGRFVQKLQKL